jgi:hypothetical protein
VRFIVTFPIGGPLRNCYSAVEADSEYDARLLLMDEYGREGWAGIYGETAEGRMKTHGLRFIPFGPVVPS